MKRRMGMFGAALLLTGAAFISAQEGPPPARPEKQHEWLHKFVGEWTTEIESVGAPEGQGFNWTGTASARSFGGIWIMAEHQGNGPAGTPILANLTLGYDPQKKKFVGTWIDSMTSYLWVYEGSLDAAETTLSLDTEGPDPSGSNKMAKYKDVFEFKTKDHILLTSSALGEDGKWTTFVTVNYRRKAS